MSVEAGLYTHLADISGSTAAARVYPVWVPQGADYPAITWQRMGSPREHTHDGASRLLIARFRVVSWAETYNAAMNLANIVRLASDGLSGTMGGESIEECLLADEADVPAEASADLDERRVFGRAVEFDIYYVEAAPSV